MSSEVASDWTLMGNGKVRFRCCQVLENSKAMDPTACNHRSQLPECRAGNRSGMRPGDQPVDVEGIAKPERESLQFKVTNVWGIIKEIER
ncbi:uncharacterized protein G2W53_024127 [Senna tora]|uniref:Uncharacterized protein n=1 Tax=Senna tora TaxID=362788 RepID=A0A834TD07_9FABA|nr:uncharacterized protein G2W53_024127 [Senna tora]